MPQGYGYCNRRRGRLSCGARLLWAHTAAGKAMPLDAAANSAGNVAVYLDVEGLAWARVISEAEPRMPAEQLYMPHFATCAVRELPPTKTVTEANARTVARRKPAVPVQSDITGQDVPLFDIPENVQILRPRRGSNRGES